MTALSTLFPSAGGGSAPYPSAGYHSIGLGDLANTWGASLSSNTDYLFPFVPRADVTVDSLYYLRRFSGGDVALGMYDNSGNLLSDCALDSVTTAGYHEVATTNFDLTAGELYWWLINTSSASAVTADFLATSDQCISGILSRSIEVPGGMYSGGTAPTASNNRAGISKSRTNAIAPSTITMSGWDATTTIIVGGIVPA